MTKLAVLFTIVLVACGGSKGDDDESPPDPNVPAVPIPGAPATTPPVGASPPPADPSTPEIPGAPATPADPIACADVTGAWRGPLDGTATLTPGLPAANKVGGTAAVSFDKAGTDFAVGAGSKLDMSIDALVIVKIPATQAVTGTVKCGKFEGKTDATSATGQHVGGTVACTMDATGCKGTFEMHQDDGTKVASGTFTLAR